MNTQAHANTSSSALPLTEEQIEQYFREGYLVVQKLVPDESIDEQMKAIPPLDAGARNWTPHSFDHSNPLSNAAMHRVLIEPRVIQAAEQIFDAPACVLWGMVAIVPAHGGKGLPWHQDNQYTQVLGLALNIFIALAEIPPERANLWVAPKSHLAGVQPSQEASIRDPEMGGHRNAVIEPTNGILLPGLHKGDAVIFDRSTYHRTLRNETDQPRYAYAAQFQASYSREATTGKRNGFRVMHRAWDLRAMHLRAGEHSQPTPRPA